MVTNSENSSEQVIYILVSMVNYPILITVRGRYYCPILLKQKLLFINCAHDVLHNYYKRKNQFHFKRNTDYSAEKVYSSFSIDINTTLIRR